MLLTFRGIFPRSSIIRARWSWNHNLPVKWNRIYMTFKNKKLFLSSKYCNGVQNQLTVDEIGHWSTLTESLYMWSLQDEGVIWSFSQVIYKLKPTEFNSWKCYIYMWPQGNGCLKSCIWAMISWFDDIILELGVGLGFINRILDIRPKESNYYKEIAPLKLKCFCYI